MVDIYRADFINCGSVYRRWLHQLWLSTEDYLINGCYLRKMASSMAAQSTEDSGGYLQLWEREDDFVNDDYLQKMTSTMVAINRMTSSIVAIYRRWLHQLWLSTEDDFINGGYLVYGRWLHQWWLSTEDGFINGGYLGLRKMTSSMATQSTEDDFINSGYIYRRWFHHWWLSTKDDFINGGYLNCWLHQWWLSNLLTSSMVAIYTYGFMNCGYLRKMTSSMVAIYGRLLY